jgi:SAM-dependent MidA family methyltransferase
MPDPDSSPPLHAVKRATHYGIEAPSAIPSLGGILHEKIERCDSMRFTDFMATALYEPALGYYSRGTRQVGRGGDFFTSVSVGPLFGCLLARRFLREWKKLGSPDRWRIIECGAHDGTLANDVLREIFRIDPAASATLEYVIPEPLARLQAAQRETLAAFSGETRFISDASELFSDPLPGVAFGNELLDALPFHVVEWKSGGWRECRVANGPDGDFIWEADHEITDAALLMALVELGSDFPEGYRTEVRTNFRGFLEPLTRCLSSGLMIWPDYGFARPEYYLPDRKTGTLRTFSNHRAAEDPLERPGELDITAHVDFTAVAEAALDLGGKPILFKSQGSWLTENGRDWLLSLEGNPDLAALRQFQTLTHPAHLGSSFHVLEISWNQPMDKISAEDRHRLALRACPGAVAR